MAAKDPILDWIYNEEDEEDDSSVAKPGDWVVIDGTTTIKLSNNTGTWNNFQAGFSPHTPLINAPHVLQPASPSPYLTNGTIGGINIMPPIPTYADLPINARDGDTHMVLDDSTMWIFDGTSKSWLQFTSSIPTP